MAYIVIAYIVMAYIVIAYIVMAYIVMAYIFMAYIFMAYIVMVYIVMALCIYGRGSDPRSTASRPTHELNHSIRATITNLLQSLVTSRECQIASRLLCEGRQVLRNFSRTLGPPPSAHACRTDALRREPAGTTTIAITTQPRCSEGGTRRDLF